MRRVDGRAPDQLRPVSIETRVQRNPEGSVLFVSGNTRVLVAASVESGVRDFIRGSGRGWITAEYSMHPRANADRQQREGRRGFLGGRTQEIQRLVGRALRSCVRLEKLGERTITIDCDVLDADGGTRTACISGGFVALMMALDGLLKKKLIDRGVVREALAAVSVGLVGGRPLLDLCYDEDSKAQVDLNLVATTSCCVVEVQGTAEGEPMTRDELGTLIELGLKGTAELIEIQKAAFKKAGVAADKLIKASA